MICVKKFNFLNNLIDKESAKEVRTKHQRLKEEDSNDK